MAEENYSSFGREFEKEIKRSLGSESDPFDLVLDEIVTGKEKTLPDETYVRALEIFKRIYDAGPIEGEKEFRKTINLLGLRIATCCKDYASVLRYVNSLIDIEPTKEVFYSVQGNALVLLGEKERARVAFENGLMFEPGDKLILAAMENLENEEI